ncbi:MAG: thiamine-phosphate kinase [Nevskia sp.]|nr:thiamine-phosphate kinase [Nevskia sp.]
MDEFELIRRYFAGLTPASADVALGIGDDCALLRPPAGEVIAVTTDTLVAGRHFPAGTRAVDLGWKALAVNLSDLAAMGARPRWFLLSLTLERAEAAWLEDFAAGLKQLADAAPIALVGGNTTRGPLAITITAVGSVPEAAALRRDGARPGDAVCVTGTLGDAALALQNLGKGPAAPATQADADFLRRRLDRPQPRLAAGLALRGLAHAAIDLSDGLAGDLAHVLESSGVGAEVQVARLPMSPAFERLAVPAQRLRLQAGGGDDYELCLCLPPEHLAEARRRLDLPLTEIGRITAAPGLRWLDEGGAALAPQPQLHGYDHFR